MPGAEVSVAATQIGALVLLQSSGRFLSLSSGRFALVAEEDLLYPLQAVFVLCAPSPAARDQGEVVKWGEAVELRTLVGGVGVSAEKTQTGVEIAVGKCAPLELKNRGECAEVRDTLCHGDRVGVRILAPGPAAFLTTKLQFRCLTSDSFQILVFSPPPQPSEVQLGYPCLLFSSNKMLLSVHPRASPDPDDSVLEEYSGTQTASLTTNREDRNAYWVLEGKSKMSGGRLETNTAFCLCHLPTGKYVTSDYSLGARAAAAEFSFLSDGVEPLQYNELSPLVAGEFAVGVSPRATKESIWTDVFKPVLPYMAVDTHMQYDLAPSKDCGLKFQVREIREEESVIRMVSLFRSLPTLKKQWQSSVAPQVPEDCKESGLTAHIASDLCILDELVRIRLTHERDSSSPIAHFATNKIQQFLSLSRQATRRFLSDKVKVAKWVTASPLAMAEVVASADLSTVPPCDLMHIAEIFTSLDLVLPSAAHYCKVYRLYAAILTVVHHRLEVSDEFLMYRAASGGKEYVLTFPSASNQVCVLGSLYDLTTIADESLQSLIVHCLHIAANVCVTHLRDQTMRNMGLRIDTFLEVLHSDVTWMKTSASFFLAEVYVPYSLARRPINTIMKSKLLTSDELLEPVPAACDWFSTSSTSLSDLIKLEVSFWLISGHSQRKDSLQLIEEVTTHLNLIRRLVDYRVISDLLVGALSYCAVAAASTVLGKSVPGFSGRFPIASTDALTQRSVVSAVVRLLNSVKEWRKLRTAQCLFRQNLIAPKRPQVTAVVSQLSVQFLFAALCRETGLKTPSEEMSDRLIGAAGFGVSELCGNFYSILTAVSPHEFLTGMLNQIVPGFTGMNEVLSLVNFELNTEGEILHFLGEIADNSAYSREVALESSLHQAQVNFHSLHTHTESALPSLQQYQLALTQLLTLITSLDEHGFQQLRSFLQRTSLHYELQRMWLLAALPTNSGASEACEELRNSVISLSRAHISGGQKEHWKQVIQVQRADCFLLDFPEYILLLQELNLLYKRDEESLRMLTYLFTAALQGTSIREVFALAQFIAGDSDLSLYITFVSDYFESKAEKRISAREAQVLSVVGLVAMTQGLEAPFIEVIQSAQFDQCDIHYLSLALTANLDPNSIVQTFLSLFDEITKNCDRASLNFALKKYAEMIETKSKLLQYELWSDEKCWLLHSIFRDRRSILHLLQSRQYGDSAAVCRKVMGLFPVAGTAALVPESLAAGVSSILQRSKALLDLDCAESVEASSPLKHAATYRPAASRRFFQVDFEIHHDRQIIQYLAEQYIGKVGELKELFPIHTVTREYLRVCKSVAKMVRPGTSPGPILRLIEELVSYIIDTEEEDNITLSLNILTILTNKLPEVRKQLLACLKSNHRYIPFFTAFVSVVQKRLTHKQSPTQEFRVSLIIADFYDTLRDSLSAYLRLFQACCDGCVYEFQCFLRVQDSKESNNINVVQVVARLLADVLGNIAERKAFGEVELAICCSTTLLEMCSGPCKPVQVDICKKSRLIPAVLKTISQVEDGAPVSLHLQHALVKLFLALMEGREKNREEIEELLANCEFDGFLRIALALSAKFSPEALNRLNLGMWSSPDEKSTFYLALDLFRLCFISMDEAALEILRGNPLMQYLSFIEIETDTPQGGRAIYSVMFVVPMKAKFLTGRTAQSVLLEADRTSRQGKLQDLVKKLETCSVEMEWQQALARHQTLKAVTKHWSAYKLYSFVLVIVINLIVLCTVSTASGSQYSMEYHWVIAVTILHSFQVLLITLGTVSYIVEYFHFFTHSLRIAQGRKDYDLVGQSDFGTLGSYYRIKSRVAEQWKVDMKEVGKAAFELGYVLLSVSAFYFPSAFPLLLLQITNLSPSVAHILKSITKRASQLVLTFVFTLVALYEFAYFAYMHLSHYYKEEGGLDCRDLMHCFFSTLNYGLRAGGGMGDALGPGQEGEFWLRMAFDTLFFIIVTTVLMAMVFGIIVDTFSQLRDEEAKLHWDMNNVCFICGHRRSLIDLKGEGWLPHITKVHNAYSYLYFLLHLAETDEKDCSGIEKTVKELVEKREIGFFPTTSRKMGFVVTDNSRD